MLLVSMPLHLWRAYNSRRFKLIYISTFYDMKAFIIAGQLFEKRGVAPSLFSITLMQELKSFWSDKPISFTIDVFYWIFIKDGP